jgi:hypothetical protein
MFSLKPRAMKGDKAVVEVRAVEPRPAEARFQYNLIADPGASRSRYVVIAIILTGVLVLVLDGPVENIALPRHNQLVRC